MIPEFYNRSLPVNASHPTVCKLIAEVDAPVTNRGGGTTPRMRRGKAPREEHSGLVPARTRRESAASTAGAPSRAVLFEALAAESVIRITPFDLRARLSLLPEFENGISSFFVELVY